MNLINRCTIERATDVNNDGEITKTYAPLTTGVACLIQEAGGGVKMINQGTGALEYDAIAFFEFGTDIKPMGPDDEKDRLAVTDPARLSGANFLVQLVADESGMGRGYLTAYLRRVRGA